MAQPSQSKALNIPLARKSTSQKVFEALREAILSHQLPAGTPLIEARLAKQFGVSKTPIREALLQLVHSGLVDYELACGVTVHSLTLGEIRDIFELRLLLEPLALRQSTPNLSQDDFMMMDNLLNEAKMALEVEDYQQLSILNSAFHRSLCQRATNQQLLKWLSSLSERRRLISLHGWAIENRSQQEWEEHRQILTAVKMGDVSLATQRLVEHMTSFAEIVLKNYPTSQPT